MNNEEFIKIAIENDKLSLLNEAGYEIINRLYANKKLVLHNGKFYYQSHDENDISLNDFVNQMRYLFSHKFSGVKNRIGSYDIVAKKAKEFKLEYDLSFKELLKIVTHYVNNYNHYTGYLCNANYFFYKKDGKFQKSYCLDVIAALNENKEKQETFTEEM